MKPAWLSGIFAAASLSAATIAGSVFDPNGAAISDAKATLSNADTHVIVDTATTADGKFSFDGVPAGEYVLRVERPGFATLFREFDVQTDSRVERGLMLTPSNDKNTPGTEPIWVEGEVAQSNLIRKVQPVYPQAARDARIQGKVLLAATISKEGIPTDIRVTSSPSDDLTQSALEAVRQWRYRPTLLNGNPVDIETQVLVNYTLSR